MKQVFYFIKRLHAFGGFVLYANLLGMVLLSLIDGIGILFLVSMITISGVINISSETSTIAPILKILQTIPEVLSLPVILALYILLVISQNILQRKLMIRNVKIQTEFIRKIRLETYGNLMQANWRFFVKKRKTDLINLLTSEIARVSSGTNLCIDFLSSLIFTAVQICIAFWLSPNITVFVILCGAVLSLFSRKFIRRARKLGGETSELARDYLAGITDQLNGIKDIKSNKLEESHLNWFDSLTKKMAIEQVEYSVLNSASQLFYKIASAILISCFIFLSAKMFQFQPDQFLLIVIIFSRLWPRITGIQSSMEKITSITPAFKALSEMQNECREAAEIGINDLLAKGGKQIRINQGIECKKVSFRYNQMKSSYALSDINLYIPSNRMTAIVGKSGAGKSTLIDILMGLLEPETGHVLIDGKQLTGNQIHSLRSSLSYVPQDPFLFNSSIRENLLMVKPEASEEELWEALQFSAASEFVSKLPDGLDTHIGDRGIRLSGGERQRLVLARAILRKPAVLILDEATSALDTENEVRIQEALERLKGTMTIIVIAHRFSTIRNADQIVVLDQGRISQIGSFTNLSKDRRGIFINLLGIQKNVGL